ncbi:hypothetical protein GCM10007036_12920 [Alsobacter metallidurans]|uniref:DUF2793 domain-containing protein n=1 Tax=Alsobacter metallidurans TaxID=340221 RepID=A0A917I5S9_9HYPH|nr:DUF2793 domain-containing protein [Alsobacter metallidurans]GGH13959.1 hypothetical protein GCM10007036_12920 [Alsobacter metallidurans]
MSDSMRLGLPYLAAAQSQKHVTHNDALQMLDGLVHCAVLERGRVAPPAAPVEGARYLLAAAATGAFAGQGGSVAAFDDGAWRFFQPRAGWRVFVIAEARLLVHDGAGWRDLDELARRLGPLDALGLGTPPDNGNPFSARLNDALFNARPAAEGGTGDVRVKLNKPLPGGAASLFFQTGFSGRAELGLAGDDAWRVRVSADGAAWRDAIAANPATGLVRFPVGVEGLPHGFRNQVHNGDFSVAQRGAGPFPVGQAAAHGFDRWLAQAAGAAAGSVSRTAFPPGQADGGPGGRFFATLAISATTTASYPELQTRMEDVATLAGRPATLSFWYRTASPAFFADLSQNFGVAGSASVFSIGQQVLPASPGVWRRFIATVTPPSIAGKAVGAGSFLSLRVFLSGGAAAAIDIADVQVEEGALATAFERRPAAIELALCRRFFRRYATAQAPADLAFEMRAAPTQAGAGPFDYSADL